MKKIHDIVEIKINTYEAYATIIYLNKDASYSDVSNLLMNEAKQRTLVGNYLKIRGPKVLNVDIYVTFKC